MNLIKEHKKGILIIVGGILILSFLLYVFIPVDVNTNDSYDDPAQDTIRALRQRIELKEEAFREQLEIERQILRDSADIEIYRRKANADYYKNLYERSKTQEIDSVINRTHIFWDNWVIPN